MNWLIPRLLKLARPLAGHILLAILLGVGTIACGVGLLATSAFVVAKAALRPPIGELQLAIVGLRFFGVGRGLLRYLERHLSHSVTLRLLSQLRVWFYDRLAPLAPARLTDLHSGDLMARILADIGTLEDFYPRVIAPPIVALLTMSAVALVLSSLDLRLALRTSAFLILAGIGLPLITERSAREPAAELVRLRSRLYVSILDNVAGMADLLAFNQAESQMRALKCLFGAESRLRGQLAHVEGIGEALVGLLAQFSIAAALWILIPLVRAGALDRVLLAVIPLGLLASFEAFGPLVGAFRRLQAGLEAGRRLGEVLQAEPAVREPRDPRTDFSAGNLAIRNLSFRYQPQGPLVLDEITLEVHEGTATAIVGPSGSGKTTLVRLLTRFWDYSQGSILLDGIDLRDFGDETLRGAFSVLPQDPYLFAGTIRDNLLMAKPLATEEELQGSLRTAHIHAFVAQLPDGLDTFIGEGGIQLSGGQRQRIAVARTMIRDSPYMILDEPTAHVDPILRRKLMRSLRASMTGRTCILITHRLMDVEDMDQIIFLGAGRIRERGTHQTLMAEGSHYRRMWQVHTQSLAPEGAPIG